MNFMPSEDAFFDEPLNQPVTQPFVPAQVLSQHPQQSTFSHLDHLSKQENDHSAQFLESSRRQEQLLERIVAELEKLNSRIGTLERITPVGNPSSTGSRIVSPGASPTHGGGQSSTAKQTRGSLVLPPGSRPANAPNLPDRKPVEAVSAAEDAAARERQEQEAILRRRAEEEARIARLEAERKQREEEEERKRIEELKRIEEERKRKEELEQKTRGLMTGLFDNSLTTTATGASSLFGPEDDLDLLSRPGAAGGQKTGGGLFDD